MTTPLSIPEFQKLHPVTKAVLFTSPAATITDLSYVVTYDNAARIASVRFKDRGLRYCRPLVLWKGDSYDAAGQFTDAQVAARIDELLGADPVAVVTALI